MKELMELKKDIKSSLFNDLYIFFGNEYAIRDQYIDAICRDYSANKKYLQDIKELYKELSKNSLFAVKTSYIVMYDYDFLKEKKSVWERLKKLSKDKRVILVYDELPSTFTTYFDEYITAFKEVTDDIATKYVLEGNVFPMEITEDIRYSCENNYGAILNEKNKMKWWKYNNEGQMTKDTKDALFYKKKRFIEQKYFSYALLQYDINWLNENLQNVTTENILMYLPDFMESIMIALYCKRDGKYQGSSAAYKAGENWGKAKEIRELKVPYKESTLRAIYDDVAQLDIYVRTGRLTNERAWNWLIGVIL